MTHVALTYLDRAAWGANPSLPRLGHVVSRAKFRGLALHHTVSVLRDWDGDGVLHGDLDDIGRFMRQLQTARPDLGADVPYSFVVLQGSTPDDAVICEGRGFDRTGAHTPGHNSTRWGVALAGNYTSEPPTPGQLEAIRWIGRQLADPAGARSTIGHRDVKATACPGDCAYPLLALVQPPFGLGQEVTVPSSDRIDVFARGDNGEVWHKWFNLATFSWSPWESLGGQCVGAPSATWFHGSLSVFVRGTDDAMWQRTYTPSGGWGDWVRLGGTLTSAPAVAVG